MTPESWRIRAFHYRGAEEIYYFVNEGMTRPLWGRRTFRRWRTAYAYDASGVQC